jgi:ribosome-associated translation inhibitor RaiA
VGEIIMIYDVRSEPTTINSIAWCNNQDVNLFTYEGTIEVRGVSIKSTEEAKNLIKALEKAIELGWVK